jgi:hypothetical protein
MSTRLPFTALIFAPLRAKTQHPRKFALGRVRRASMLRHPKPPGVLAVTAERPSDGESKDG